ncbi:MAG: response regulator [Gemmatimonadaceae bacterium]|nr:response regulator [Gemmatimonadaceae bacterium]
MTATTKSAQRSTDGTLAIRRSGTALDRNALQKAIFNSSTFSSIATDAEGVIQIFNVGAEKMLGYSASEVVDQITPAQIHKEEELVERAAMLSLEYGTTIAPGFEALVYKAARGIEDIYPLTKVRKDGSTFPAIVSVTALRDADEAIIGYLLIGTDNTARQQVEEERMKLDQRLRDQHFYTRSLIESNIDAIMTTDPRGIITDVNKQAEALTGCTRDELIGAPFKNYFSEPAVAQAGIARVLSEGKVSNYELTAVSRDGVQTVVSFNANTFHDRERTLQGVFVAARDVTELKLVQQKLEQQNVELQDGSRLKSEFLANMSHELRTPLNAIIGFSELMCDGVVGDLTTQQSAFVDNIFTSGKHLLSLINDILDLSKVEAGKMTLELESVDVSPLLMSCLSIVRERAMSQHVRLVLSSIEEMGCMEMDPRRIKQIVYNLLSNAVKFSERGGQVTLSTALTSRAEVGVLGEGLGRTFPLPDNDFDTFLKISVSDGGIGIAPAGMAQLFRPFSQIDGGLARKFEGTGLGLAMVKLLAELHGGTVAVQSAVGQGSTFTVWVPVRTPEPSPLATTDIPQVAATPGERVALIVEDDPKSAELIRAQLEAEGFRVVHAGSAESALVVALQQPLALITLDIMLPNMDGWELLSRLKQVPDLQRVPIVMISIVADRSKGFALGAAAVMQKPLSRKELHDSLADMGLLPAADGRKLKILIVDDDQKSVELIAAHVEDFASEILRAYTGADAIEIAHDAVPDLIFLDLMMPGVNGFDVAKALQADNRTMRIPILVVTAKSITTEDRARLHGYVNTILEKGEMNQKLFAAEIRRAMAGRSGAG